MKVARYVLTERGAGQYLPSTQTNRHKYQAQATNTLADLVEICPGTEDYISFPPLEIGVNLLAFRSKPPDLKNRF